jgi:hypothetical protein
MKRTALSLAVLAVLAGCASDAEAPAAPKTSLATAQAGELTVELLADGPLATGLTPVYLEVRRASGEAVTDATVTFRPWMEMATGTSHGAPTLGPPALDAGGLYRCDVVFQMPSGAAGSWSATAGVTLPGAAEVVASFPSLGVADSGRARTFLHTDPETSAVTKYVSSLDFEAAPRVGLNPIVFTLHRMADAETFPPVDDAILVLHPQMPSMGHGAPGSVDPTLSSAGVYRGQLSFTMAGEWETTVSVSRGGVVVGDPVFAVTF